MKSRSITSLLVACGLLFGCGNKDAGTENAPSANATSVSAEQAALQIQDDYMRSIIQEISQDSYEGRGPGSRADHRWR